MRLKLYIIVSLLLVALPFYAQRNKVVETPEQAASFQGGEEALAKYLAEHALYPEAAMSSGMSGTVVVRFVVEKNGDVKEAEVSESAGEHLDRAALGVVRAMPRWVPARDKGKKVRSAVVLPIKYELSAADRHMTFCGIALGQGYELFDEKLATAGFDVQGRLIHEAGQSAEMRRFTGSLENAVFDFSYAVGDVSHKVYYVSGRTRQMLSRAEATALYEKLRQQYGNEYGQGFVTSLSDLSGYTIQNAYGTVELGVEQQQGNDHYAVVVQVSDAKAYGEAYSESLSPKSFLTEPRPVVNGEAAIRVHTPYVYVADALPDCKSKDEVRQLLSRMEYKITADAGNTITALLSLGGQYGVRLNITFTKETVTSVVATASPEDVSSATNDIEMGLGYQLKSQNTKGRNYVKGQRTLLWKTDGTQQTLTIRQGTPAKNTPARRRRRK